MEGENNHPSFIDPVGFLHGLTQVLMLVNTGNQKARCHFPLTSSPKPKTITGTPHHHHHHMMSARRNSISEIIS